MTTPPAEAEAADDAETGCYISYESAPPPWTLDDGTRPPGRSQHCARPSYDPAERTFRGTAEWSPPATFGGSASWDYEVIFAEDLECIVGGRELAIAADGSEGATHRFASPELQERDPVGPRPLVYERVPEEREQMLSLMHQLQART